MALQGAEENGPCAAQANDSEEKHSILDPESLLNASANVGMSNVGDDRQSK